MALKAKLDFPSIEFKKSIMIGDSESDMIFGKTLGIKCFRIIDNPILNETYSLNMNFQSLFECTKFISNRIDD